VNEADKMVVPRKVWIVKLGRELFSEAWQAARRMWVFLAVYEQTIVVLWWTEQRLGDLATHTNCDYYSINDLKSRDRCNNY